MWVNRFASRASEGAKIGEHWLTSDAGKAWVINPTGGLDWASSRGRHVIRFEDNNETKTVDLATEGWQTVDTEQKYDSKSHKIPRANTLIVAERKATVIEFQPGNEHRSTFELTKSSSNKKTDYKNNGQRKLAESQNLALERREIALQASMLNVKAVWAHVDRDGDGELSRRGACLANA